jgi:hypothetical protein
MKDNNNNNNNNKKETNGIKPIRLYNVIDQT